MSMIRIMFQFTQNQLVRKALTMTLLEKALETMSSHLVEKAIAYEKPLIKQNQATHNKRLPITYDNDSGNMD